MSPQPAQFVWYQLSTRDPDAAAAFYTHVAGWSSQDAGMPGMPYALFLADGRRIAGMAQPGPDCEGEFTPGWLGYVGVEDVDAVAEAATKAGGSVLQPPLDIPGVGRFAIIADPGGAALALFRSTYWADEPPPPMGAPGHIGWHELYAADGAEAFQFYTGLFGWTPDMAMPISDGEVYQLFRAGGHAIGGMMTRMPDMPAPLWNYYINVPELDAAAERVRHGGGQILNGPMEVPGGNWIVVCLDPQGIMISLVAPRR